MAEEGFVQLLSRAQHDGELARHQDPRALAHVLVTMMQGTIVMIKAGTPDDVVRQTAETAFSILDSRRLYPRPQQGGAHHRQAVAQVRHHI